VRDGLGREQSIAGVGRNDWRFSGDGRHVAAIAGDGERRSLVVLDLATGIARELGRPLFADRVEWTRQGVVVRELRRIDPSGRNDRRRLVYYPLAGSGRTLVERRNVEHYATAASGARVVFFASARDGASEIFDFSVEGGAPIARGRLRDVIDAEVAPDGSRAAVTTTRGVFLLDGRRPRRVGDEAKVSTLWFSPDGARLLFASPERATLLDGGERHRLALDGARIESARFVAGGEVLLAVEKSLVRWNPSTGEHRAIATARDGETFLAADLFAGEFVFLAQRSTSKDAIAPPVVKIGQSR